MSAYDPRSKENEERARELGRLLNGESPVPCAAPDNGIVFVNLQEIGLEIYSEALRTASLGKQTVGDKHDLYVTVEQLEHIVVKHTKPAPPAAPVK